VLTKHSHAKVLENQRHYISKTFQKSIYCYANNIEIHYIVLLTSPMAAQLDQ